MLPISRNLGAAAIGKSALVIKGVQDHFSPGYDPTIEDSYRKEFLVDDQKVLCDILDTTGDETHAEMRPQ